MPERPFAPLPGRSPAGLLAIRALAVRSARAFALARVGWAVFLLLLPLACGAQQPAHLSVAGRDVAMWKPKGTAPLRGYPLIVFSHGFTGCNTQTTFLMEALAQAGYLVLAPNHEDAGCGRARHAGGRVGRPQELFRESAKWSERTYADRRGDMEAVLDVALAPERLEGVAVDASRVGIAGHSLGGYTVLGLAGWPSWKDPRVKAVLALSPHCSPFVATGRLAQMNIPVMYQGRATSAKRPWSEKRVAPMTSRRVRSTTLSSKARVISPGRI